MREYLYDDPWGRIIVDVFEYTLYWLAHNPARLVGALDWPTKRSLIEEAAARGKDIYARKFLDLNYHGMQTHSVGRELKRRGVLLPIIEDDLIRSAIAAPPQGTRAEFLQKVLLLARAHNLRIQNVSFSRIAFIRNNGQELIFDLGEVQHTYQEYFECFMKELPHLKKRKER